MLWATCNKRFDKPVTDDKGGITGRGAGIRTPDLLLPKQARYQAALRPESEGGNRLFQIFSGPAFAESSIPAGPAIEQPLGSP